MQQEIINADEVKWSIKDILDFILLFSITIIIISIPFWIGLLIGYKIWG